MSQILITNDKLIRVLWHLIPLFSLCIICFLRHSTLRREEHVIEIVFVIISVTSFSWWFLWFDLLLVGAFNWLLFCYIWVLILSFYSLSFRFAGILNNLILLLTRISNALVWRAEKLMMFSFANDLGQFLQFVFHSLLLQLVVSCILLFFFSLWHVQIWCRCGLFTLTIGTWLSEAHIASFNLGLE